MQTIDALPGWRHLAFDEVDSTNAEALRLAKTDERGRLWVTADRQNEGRGRNGRNWVSEPGNLYASLLLIERAEDITVSNLPLVAAVGVYRALKPLFPRAPYALAIKWPNDILVDGAKINGILLESQMLDDRVAIAIGCGINCAHHPDDTLYPATDLATCGKHVTPQRMFSDLAVSMAKTLEIWNRGAGFAEIREDWLRAAVGVGGPVTVNLRDEKVSGLFENIDTDGYLRLRLKDGSQQRISAGDLFFQ